MIPRLLAVFMATPASAPFVCVNYLLMLTNHRQLFTNLEVNSFHLHLPGFQRPDVFSLCFIALLVKLNILIKRL